MGTPHEGSSVSLTKDCSLHLLFQSGTESTFCHYPGSQKLFLRTELVEANCLIEMFFRGIFGHTLYVSHCFPEGLRHDLWRTHGFHEGKLTMTVCPILPGKVKLAMSTRWAKQVIYTLFGRLKKTAFNRVPGHRILLKFAKAGIQLMISIMLEHPIMTQD